MLSGRLHGEVPFDIEGPPSPARSCRCCGSSPTAVLTMRTPIGRKVRPEIRKGGGPLLRVKRADLAAAGVKRTDARVAGVQNGKPVLDDGRVLDVANVIWCTGFGKDVAWIDIPVLGEDGWPEQTGGAVKSSPGLYFVGLPFLTAFASMLIGGVGRDAEVVAKQIAATATAGSSRRPQALAADRVVPDATIRRSLPCTPWMSSFAGVAVHAIVAGAADEAIRGPGTADAVVAIDRVGGVVPRSR